MVETWTQSAPRYAGASPWSDLYTITAILKRILFRIGSQCRILRTGVMWSYFLVPEMSLAAALVVIELMGADNRPSNNRPIDFRYENNSPVAFRFHHNGPYSNGPTSGGRGGRRAAAAARAASGAAARAAAAARARRARAGAAGASGWARVGTTIAPCHNGLAHYMRHSVARTQRRLDVNSGVWSSRAACLDASRLSMYGWTPLG